MPATLRGLAFFVAEGLAEDDVLEAVWLLTLAATEDTADETDDAEDEETDVTAPTAGDEAETAVAATVEVEAHTTALGRPVTPAALQKLCAYATAVCWSTAEQAPARQQAIPLRKFWFEQIHTMSMLEHPPISDPLVYSVTHPVCTGEYQHGTQLLINGQ
jgi:hypothetical protein